jgi:hypothetical protein
LYTRDRLGVEQSGNSAGAGTAGLPVRTVVGTTQKERKMQRLDIGDMESRVFRFEITKEDFTCFVIFHCKHSKTFLQQRRKSAIISALVFAVGWFFIFGWRDYAWQSDYSIREALIPTIIIPVIFAAIIIWSAGYGIGEYLRRRMKHIGYPEILGSCTLTLTADAIRVDKGGYVIETNYSLIRDIAFNSDALYIYVGEIAAYIIPNTAFENETGKNEQDIFVEFLRAKANLAA